MRFRTALCVGLASVLTVVLAAQAQVPGVNNNFPIMWNMVWEASTLKATYSATTAGVVPAAAATDVCTLAGSSTKTIKVRRLIFGGTNANLQADPVSILKRSTLTTVTNANSLATAMVPYDSMSAAATAFAETLTGNGTLGTLVGIIVDRYLVWGGTTTSVVQPPMTEFKFGELGSPVVLRNANEELSVNLGGLTYTSAVFSCTWEWTEE